MSNLPPVWVFTPLFSRSLAPQELDPDIHIIHYDPSRPKEQLLMFRRIREDEGDRPVMVFDIARFADDTAWAYVADAVNRSGANPLRGLTAVTRVPFIDLSYLYHIPAGQTGLEVVALGARYSEIEPALFEPARGRPLCSYLHDAAILAHAEGLQVTGVLVVETHAPRFDFQQVRIS